jgi:hypothetical protein
MQYPLSIVRHTAQHLLDELAADRDLFADAYWVSALAGSLQQMLDATAPEDGDAA